MTILLDNDDKGREIGEKINAEDDYIRENQQIVSIENILGPGIGKDTELEDLIPPRVYLNAFRSELSVYSLERFLPNLPADDEFVSQAAKVPLVDLVEQLVGSMKLEEEGFKLHKTALIEHVFEQLEKGEILEEDQLSFEASLKSATSKLLDRVEDNVRRRKYEEVRKAVLFYVRDFKRKNKSQAPKSQGRKLLETMKTVGRDVSKSGKFETVLARLAEDFDLDGGQTHDKIPNYDSFIARILELSGKLTIDEG